MRIERVIDAAVAEAGGELFDEPPKAAETEQFLSSPCHHLLFAYDDQTGAVIGMISGVETTHPDKGTEMFLYELGVVATARKGGCAAELVRALAALAKARGCYGPCCSAPPRERCSCSVGQGSRVLRHVGRCRR